ncbi:family 78 glycoside hydrolase catalytic domain [Tessaracoccus defluvii]|uniref:alpha-L-rhamnosidase n=1 Tax=Tessaracoccus defluvii TaxID=1285901 RepID=A0A7H0H531_9ACTN|nr:family 78 glycoside hydrolase catalytic domain [Tessaracoccus defluvii]QNP55647.1 family 78 glycoside hydrolase catalytic domain [Tessaracoccus defluvii]
MTKIAFLHTGAVVIPGIEALAHEALPEAEVLSLLDPTVVRDLTEGGDVAATVPGRLIALAVEAREAGADALMFTCSSISGLAGDVQRAAGLPVLRIDEAMADTAAAGERIAVIATLPTTLEPTIRLIRERAELQGLSPAIDRVLVEGAFDAVVAGDGDRHDALVGAAIVAAADSADVIVLAQASAARAAAKVSVAVPVLTSPELGVARFASFVTSGRPAALDLASQYPAGLLGVPAGDIQLTWRTTAPATGYQLRHADQGGQWQVAEPVDGVAVGPVPAPGGPLAPRDRRRYAVRLRDGEGWGAWSDALTVEAGVAGADLEARLVGIASETEGPAPHLRREFDIPGPVRRAVLRVSAHGLYECELNGARTDDEYLAPGWTSHQARTVIATHDVTALLRPGRNAIGVRLADGWYRGRIGWTGRTDLYGHDLAALVQLEMELADGTTMTIASDGQWRGGFGSVRSSSIYDGTVTDLTLTATGFSEPGFDDSAWASCTVLADDLSTFEPRIAEPIRVIEERPMAATQRPDGIQFDSGQNLSGWVRLEVEGTRGDVVTIRHAEILEPSGDLHTAALRTAKATDTYVLAGGREVLEPAFTFHGFRYAQVETTATVLSATAIAVSSDLPVRSTFECSHEALTQFHRNVGWSLRGNFLSVPTDCPQRDERLGWTGDAQAFALTASTLVQARSFWTSWLRDLAIDQGPDGAVASVVPNIVGPDDLVFGQGPVESMGRAGWADAATIVPWSVYESYGDTLPLRLQLDSMRRWIDSLEARADGGVLPHEPFQYGDWLDPDAPGDRPWDAKTDVDYVANAFYVQSLRILAWTEDLVGDAERSAALHARADEVAAETWRRWGSVAYATQTGAALALEFGLCPDDERAAVAAALAERVDATDGRIETGFLGTPLVLSALSGNGHLDQAYRLLLRRESPSWLYQVDRGATTVWERWDAIREDGSIHGGEMDIADGGSMLSFNHYAYGAMIDWVYRTVAGLAPDPVEPGYRRIVVAPRPTASITWAKASIEAATGRLSIDWRLAEDRLEIDLEVPVGSTAELWLPVTGESTVTGVDDQVVGPGRYAITIEKPQVATL